MKLHKLVYYCQAWSLVWEEEPLFGNKIEALDNGPIIEDLYKEHKGLFKINKEDISKGIIDNLSQTKKETIDLVLGFYGDKTAQYLIALSRKENPWIKTRERNSSINDQNCKEEITLADIHEYYHGL